jgi:hypothetical protein
MKEGLDERILQMIDTQKETVPDNTNKVLPDSAA